MLIDSTSCRSPFDSSMKQPCGQSCDRGKYEQPFRPLTFRRKQPRQSHDQNSNAGDDQTSKRPPVQRSSKADRSKASLHAIQQRHSHRFRRHLNLQIFGRRTIQANRFLLLSVYSQITSRSIRSPTRSDLSEFFAVRAMFLATQCLCPIERTPRDKKRLPIRMQRGRGEVTRNVANRVGDLKPLDQHRRSTAV